MTSRLPIFSDVHKICIICEGNEECQYFKRLIELGVWQKQYEFKLVNANGNGNIVARYQDAYQNDNYELVLIFCDTEKKPYEQYYDIKRKINEFHGLANAGDEVVIFANPCTLQIVIKHWGDDVLKTTAKAVTASLIKEYTGICNYKGRLEQIEKIVSLINVDNYNEMKKRVSEMDSNDSIIGSSNFIRFIVLFESKNSNWIKQINNKLL